MSETPLGIRFFETEAGNEPVRKWLEQLDRGQMVKISEDIETVREGWPEGMPTCKYIRDGIYEVRSSLPGKIRSRVLFCIHESYIMLLHGFIKKTQAIPKKDIDLALKRKKQLEAR